MNSSEEQLKELSEKNLKLLEENKDYKDVKEKLDNGNNFIDYLLVIGQEPSIYREKWLYSENLETLNSKYKEQLKPKIISYFPPFEKSTIAFDDSILMHIFPNGYKLIKSKSQPKYKVFSFILDNNFYNLNYPQKYLTCLICYESILQYKLLQELEKNDVNLKNIDKKNFISEAYTEIYIPKCILIMSLYPFFGEFEKILTEIYSYSQNMMFQKLDLPLSKIEDRRKITFRRMNAFREVTKEKETNKPIEKIIENLLLELPVPPRGVVNIEYILDKKRIIKQNKMNELPLLDINLKKIFVDFSVNDIITIYNYIFLESRILFFSKNIEYLNNFIYGLLALLYPFQYQYQIVTILPQINLEMIESPTPFIAGINQSYTETFFEDNNFILEDLILVVDIDNKKLKMTDEEIKIPEFPIKYKKNFEKKLQEIVNKYLKVYKVERNNRKLKTVNSVQSDIRKHYESISGVTLNSSIATNATIESSKSIVMTQSEFINHINSIEEESEFLYEENTINDEVDEKMELLNNLNIDYNFNQEISDAFFNFNAILLSNYNQFLNRDFYSSNTMPCLEILFKVPNYLKIISPWDKKFYEKFIEETQIFGDFIYLRMIPKNSKERSNPHVLYLKVKLNFIR